MKKILIISLLIAIISLPFGVYVRSQVIERAEAMLANGTRTYASIIQKYHYDYGRYGGQVLVYKFTDRWTGQEHIKSIDVDKETYSSVQEGSRINVIYDPANPTNSNRLDLYEYRATIPKVDFAVVCLIPISMFILGILVMALVKGLLSKLQSLRRLARS